MKRLLSIVVPVYNEAPNIQILVESVAAVMDRNHQTFEILLVDDGSRDHTFDAIRRAAEKDSRVRGIRFRRNFGQTAAIKAGAEHAQGEVCITMDGDLQHDPEQIPRFLQKIDEGFDLVCGFRKKRNDSLFRRIPSKVANFLARKISGLRLSDFGSTYRAYRTSLLKEIPMYGEMHRFVPIFFAGVSSRITEIPINVQPRRFGKSKYGLGRTLRVFSDLLSLFFFSGFFNRPIHIFGYMAILLGLPGFLILFWLSMGKIIGSISIMDYGPLFILGVLLCLVAVQVFTSGVVCEYLLRIYYKKDRPLPYHVAETTFKDL
jgi:glycosyltransferase involved in cell wall biosynthesis